MRYTTEIVIDLPRDRVIELMDDVDNLKHWQAGLQSVEHISGQPGQVGAKSKMVFDENGRTVEMVETITKRNFPDEYDATYEAGGVYNIQENQFIAEGPDKTRWVSVSEFQFSGFMRIMAFFMGGAFRKQSQKVMQDFKRFAENAERTST